MKCLRVFMVTGGQSFSLSVKGNPPMHHNGGKTLYHCLCSEEESEFILEYLREQGCKVFMTMTLREHEQPSTPEVWPTEQCPTCAWGDLELSSLCGARMVDPDEGWEEGAFAIALKNPKFEKDLQTCPKKIH